MSNKYVRALQMMLNRIDNIIKKYNGLLNSKHVSKLKEIKHEIRSLISSGNISKNDVMRVEKELSNLIKDIERYVDSKIAENSRNNTKEDIISVVRNISERLLDKLNELYERIENVDVGAVYLILGSSIKYLYSYTNRLKVLYNNVCNKIQSHSLYRLCVGLNYIYNSINYAIENMSNRSNDVNLLYKLYVIVYSIKLSLLKEAYVDGRTGLFKIIKDLNIIENKLARSIFEISIHGEPKCSVSNLIHDVNKLISQVCESYNVEIDPVCPDFTEIYRVYQPLSDHHNKFTSLEDSNQIVLDRPVTAVYDIELFTLSFWYIKHIVLISSVVYNVLPHLYKYLMSPILLYHKTFIGCRYRQDVSSEFSINKSNGELKVKSKSLPGYLEGLFISTYLHELHSTNIIIKLNNTTLPQFVIGSGVALVEYVDARIIWDLYVFIFYRNLMQNAEVVLYYGIPKGKLFILIYSGGDVLLLFNVINYNDTFVKLLPYLSMCLLSDNLQTSLYVQNNVKLMFDWWDVFGPAYRCFMDGIYDVMSYWVSKVAGSRKG